MRLGVLMSAIVAAGVCAADSITIDGVTHDGVYIRESATRYYIQVAADGRVFSVAKSRVPESDVHRSPNEAERQELLEQWGANRSPQPRESDPPEPPLEKAAYRVASNPPSPKADSGAPRDPARVGRATRPRQGVSVAASPASTQPSTVSDGLVQGIRLEDVALRDALNALLRPLNLDYQVQDGYIWVTTPTRIRTGGVEDMQVRSFELDNAGAEDLPKVGVTHFGGPSGYFP